MQENTETENHIQKITIGLLFLVAGAAAGYYFGYDVGFERGVDVTTQETPEVHQSLFMEDFAVGIGGIFFQSKEGAAVPEEYVTHSDICGSSKSSLVSWDRAGSLDLVLELPNKYLLDEDSLNTGVIACEEGEVVYTARRAYTRSLENSRADIVIGRSMLTHDTTNSFDPIMVVATEIGGRAAVLALPHEEGKLTKAYFPEPFGYTFVHASGLPLQEFLELAETVALATAQ